ncbi:telomerase reverse transcriptase [Ordospora colligata OC4]|uniref:Telomerase reverse transcriptase n=1 Tax=Ordospora colligata OC4 TaxID=1354746 RepID=A0A0B2UKH5_9MICR|nr:telomerase reverse transcriptase [Ordospora colligata OC4]KHN69838.1 telomerase reverse transcriptase [Ordospora colligata OC4]TBU16008.1 telomerase reverse transcriptase [Ordospora colligata]
MLNLLKSLHFQTLRSFLSEYITEHLPDVVDTIYVKSSCVPNITSFECTQSCVSLISKAVRCLVDRGMSNQLCSGYILSTDEADPGKILCTSPFVSSNMLKSHEWTCVINAIGDQLAVHLLTECTLVQKANNVYVLLAGDFSSLYKMYQKPVNMRINRDTIFHKHIRVVSFVAVKAFEYIFQEHNLHKYKTMQTDVMHVLQKIERSVAHLPLSPMFKSYFHCEINIENKTGIMECSIKYSKLVDFLFLISKKLFANVFDFESFRILKSRISLLVHRNRYENISNTEMMKYFKISRFKFFRSVKCTRHEFCVRSRIVNRFLTYITENIFVAVMSKYFYSTETSFSKFKVYYFPRSSWRYFSSMHISSFLDRFETIEPCKPYLYSELRCIPKANGMRVVCNMSKARDGKQSINSRVYPEFCILRNECYGNLGNSVINQAGMYEKLAPYLSSVRGEAYILKVDVSGCFDSIPQEHVMRIVKDTINKSTYYISNISALEAAGIEVRCRQIYKASNNIMTANTLVEDACGVKLRNKLVKENAGQRVLRKEEVCNAIAKVINKNVIRYHGKHFVQRTGIPQGSIASTLLCSLYYNKIDELYFNAILKDGMLVRYVDDFLVISPSLDEILRFLQVFQSISHLGMNLSSQKIESNFGIEKYMKHSDWITDAIMHKSDLRIIDKPVIWCGMKIYANGFCVKPCVADPYMMFSITHAVHHPGQGVAMKIGNMLRNRMSKMYIDRTNLKTYENIYDIFLLCGKKLVLHLKRMDFINQKFVANVLENSKMFIIKTCRERGVSISKRMIESMSSKAFEKSGLYKIMQIRE